MKIQNSPITISLLQSMADKMYGDMVKAVVDIQKNIVAIDAEMHVDLEQELLESGSNQSDLWGINLYPQKFGTVSFIEFDSMINIRPSQQNRSRYVESETIRKKIIGIVKNKVVK